MKQENSRITLAYVDDIISSGESKKNIDSTINNFQNWAQHNRKQINKNKSGLMMINHKSNQITKWQKKTKTQGFPIVNKYKYLGIYLDNSMNMKYQTKELKKKMLHREKILRIYNKMETNPVMII